MKAKWEVEAKIIYIMEKTSKEIETSNEYSQIMLPLSNSKEITSGDWIIVSGKVSMQDAIGHVYVQWKTSSGTTTSRLGSFYNSSNTKTEETIYWIYRVPDVTEGETINYAQLACAKADGGSVASVDVGTKITLTDFFIARLPKAAIDKLTVKIAEEESAEMTKVPDSNPESIQYSPSVNLTVPVGKIVCLYDREAVNNGYKSHYLNGSYKEQGAWAAIYPSNTAQSIVIITDVPEEKTCNWLQVGLQNQGLDSLTITNLEIRVIPDSVYLK